MASIDLKLIQKYYDGVRIDKIRRQILVNKNQRAAKVIQKFWRHYRSKRKCTDLLDLTDLWLFRESIQNSPKSVHPKDTAEKGTEVSTYPKVHERVHRVQQTWPHGKTPSGGQVLRSVTREVGKGCNWENIQRISLHASGNFTVLSFYM